MNLADVLNGNIKIGKNTSITYNGQVYRGEKAIKELAEKEVGNGTDSAPAAAKPKQRRSRAKTAGKTSADAKAVEQPAGEPTDATAGDGNTQTQTTTSQ